MRIWYRESYAATAADAAGAWITRFLTPDGMLHDPGSTGKLSRPVEWLVHRIGIYVLATTTGQLKHGVMIVPIMAMDYPGSYLRLPSDPASGVQNSNWGINYAGPPFIATHGVGWVAQLGALADTDKVGLKVLYEPVKPEGR